MQGVREGFQKPAFDRGIRRIPDLDATRGLAALLVCLGHTYSLSAFDKHGSSLRRLANGVIWRILDGSAAVDYFFVLSGFVLALPYVGERRKPLYVDDFVLRRVLRIMPTYWAGLIVTMLLRSLIAPHWDYLLGSDTLGIDWRVPMSADDLWTYASLIWRNLNLTLINGPIWSLAVEMQISLILPLAIAPFYCRQTAVGSSTVMLIAMFLALRFGNYGALPFLPIFVLGIVLADLRHFLVERFEKVPTAWRIMVFVLACLCFWNRAVQSRWTYPDVEQEWLSGLGGGVFLLFILSHAQPKWLLDNAFSRFLGQISYSFYLMHVPILFASFVALRSFGLSDVLTVPFALVAAVAGSSVLYYVVENPSIRFGRAASGWWQRVIRLPG